MTTPRSSPSTNAPAGELFELELLGQGTERRYRRARPEVEAMPWGTLDADKIPADARIAARRAWTAAAFQEHRTGLAVSAALRALFECRAPVDLIAMASRFPLDELVHVELCARMAMELGGGTEIRHDPDLLIVDPDDRLPPLLRAGDMIVRFFCVGEALSIPLLRGTWHAARHPLPRAILGRIVRDEAMHGTFGFIFLDWALPKLDEKDREHLGRAADSTIRAIQRQWNDVRANRNDAYDESVGDALGWMQSDLYLVRAAEAMESRVRKPLRARGIPLSA
jgi:hypothetical protein